jgi:hypothetical protein
MVIGVRRCFGKTEVHISCSARKKMDTNHITNQVKQKTIGQQKMYLLQKLNHENWTHSSQWYESDSLS